MKIVFFGSPEFAVPSLEACARGHEIVGVVTQPDRPAGRGHRLQAPAVKVAAAARGLPVLQPLRIREPAVLAELAALAADAFVVVAYGRILPQALLDVPPRGCWNAHASLLPALRGAGPIQWAIIRGLDVTGVSIMRMEAGLDTGPVAAAASLPITADDTAGVLAPRLATLGADLLARTLPAIADGSVTTVAQDDSLATDAPPLRKEDGHLDFAQPAAVVSARARGVDPWPGAFARHGEAAIKLFRARVVPRPAPAVGPADVRGGPGAVPVPGDVMRVDAQGLVVACGDDAVSFGELQMPGRSRLSAAAAATGRVIGPGVRLG